MDLVFNCGQLRRTGQKQIYAVVLLLARHHGDGKKSQSKFSNLWTHEERLP